MDSMEAVVIYIKSSMTEVFAHVPVTDSNQHCELLVNLRAVARFDEFTAWLASPVQYYILVTEEVAVYSLSLDLGDSQVVLESIVTT